MWDGEGMAINTLLREEMEILLCNAIYYYGRKWEYGHGMGGNGIKQVIPAHLYNTVAIVRAPFRTRT